MGERDGRDRDGYWTLTPDELRRRERDPAVVALRKPVLMGDDAYLRALDEGERTRRELVRLGVEPEPGTGGLADHARLGGWDAGDAERAEEVDGPHDTTRVRRRRPAQWKMDWDAAKQAMRPLVEDGTIRNKRELRTETRRYVAEEDDPPGDRTVRNRVNEWAKEWSLPEH